MDETNEREQNYWDDRAQRSISYDNDDFYTVTPLPLYLLRRQYLLQLFEETMEKLPVGSKICDFGCGDGWYADYVSKRFPRHDYYGVDISNVMLEKARLRNPNIQWLHSTALNKLPEDLDLVYSFAVLAHIQSDVKLEQLISTIAGQIRLNGKFILFEQVAPFRHSGDSFVRRRSSEYVELCCRNGFILKQAVLLSFDWHKQFERSLAKVWYKYLSSGSTEQEKRVSANTNRFFRMLSSFFLKLSSSPIKADTVGWGNTYMIFEKVK